MVRVLIENVPSYVCMCENCHAILSYYPEDIYEHHFIYCPRCRHKQRILFDPDYDGVV